MGYTRILSEMPKRLGFLFWKAAREHVQEMQDAGHAITFRHDFGIVSRCYVFMGDAGSLRMLDNYLELERENMQRNAEDMREKAKDFFRGFFR